ncbi:MULTISPECIES: helix-turn-helix domain-containing protein [unclassified Modestobacter]
MTADVLTGVGRRLRALRRAQGLTLAALTTETGLTASTLSRLEPGRVHPTLAQLLPLARVHGLPLDDLVGAPRTGDPRLHLVPTQRAGVQTVPLARRPGGVQVYEVVFPPLGRKPTRALRSHPGHQVFTVLDGAVRFVLGDAETTLGPGETAEFDARVPHWIGSADRRPAELLMLFGPQGERSLRPGGAPARS